MAVRDDHVLSLRALNRALLARHALLHRAPMGPGEALAQIVGLQAQAAPAPLVSLWSRLESFARDDLSRLVERREVVRATLMRATLHLVTADDYVLFRAALQPVLSRALRAFFKDEAQRLDLARIVDAARALLTERPRTLAELRDAMTTLVPDEDPASLVFAVRMHLPLVQTPPTEGKATHPCYAVAETWLGRPLAPPQEGYRTLVRRYLAAFGPATRRDLEVWSGLSGLTETIAVLHDEIRVLRDQAGRELLDLADGILPDPSTPAPVRFLAEWDSLLLGHADRTRVLPDAIKKAVIRPPGRILATFLVDGFVSGLWRIERSRGRATLVIEPLAALSREVRQALEEEGERLLRFRHAEALPEIVWKEVP